MITAEEQDTLPLPAQVINADGSLDLYPDVVSLFRPTYHRGKPSIQCGGWVGYIPLNDSFALDVTPRVPIGNLERLIGLAAGYTPKVLLRHSRQFDIHSEQPQSLTEVLADQLIVSFDRIWNSGLLKSYIQETTTGSFPSGRIGPFKSVLQTSKSGRPVAVSTRFRRTADNEPNRVLRLAFEKLLRQYTGAEVGKQRERFLRLKRAHTRLEAASHSPAQGLINFDGIARLIGTLGVDHLAYGDALMVAQLVLHDVGLSIRGEGEVALLPSILIDMALMFEDYIRRVLAFSLQTNVRIEVKDGNRGEPDGARKSLFEPAQPKIKNSVVTPDIVILKDGKPELVIDAKYKGASPVPDRADINQAILYGARYDAPNVMLLHAARPEGRAHVELSGQIGPYRVYNGMINLNAHSIEDEERAFVQAVRELI